MSKTLKQICDAVLSRAGLGKDAAYFNSNDETIAYLANESANHLIRAHPWQVLRKTATISMTTATAYDLPSDIKYYVADSMNADGQERFIQYPAPTANWWYFKTHSPTGIRYLVRQTNDQIEIQNPDNGVDIKYEYISAYPVQSNGASTPDKAEFTADNDVWLLDDEMIILDLKWRTMSINGVEGWQTEKMIFNDYLRRYIGQEEGSTTLDFTQSSSHNNPEPYTDLYI